MVRKIKSVFDESHEELLKIGKSVENQWESWTIAEEIVRDKGYTITTLKKSPITFQDLSKFNILIIGAPQTSFTKEEITSIVEFVKNGGCLLALNGYGGDIQNNTNLSEITKYFGIKFNNDMVHDKLHNIKGHSYGPIISDLEFISPITYNIREFNIVLGCSLSVTDEAQVVFRSSKDAYVKVLTPTNKWVEKEMPLMPILAVYKNKSGEGRVVALGDSHIFSDDDVGMSLFNNRCLFSNILEWLSDPSLDIDDRYSLLYAKLIKTADDLVLLKKKLGIIETGSSIYERRTHLPDEIMARIDKLENILEEVEKTTGKEKIKYYKSRIRLEVWAVIISISSLLTVIILNLLINP